MPGWPGSRPWGQLGGFGAAVTGYDVRPETRGEVESVGARFLALDSVSSASGEGGYARALSGRRCSSQQDELTRHIARRDVIITTAQVPGRRPPVLVTADAIDKMLPGSVIIDMAASSLGGNVVGSVPDTTTVTPNGVSIIGAGNLAAGVPGAASSAFSHNIGALLSSLISDGTIAIDLGDEIQAGLVVAHDGAVVHPGTARLLAEPTTATEAR